MNTTYKYLKYNEIKELKEKLWLRNNKKCPILNNEYPLDKMVLDHNHKRKDEDIDINKGTVREALHRNVNVVLGKLENAVKRYGLTNEPGFNLPDFLRRAADYFERGAYCEDNTYFVHPSERKKDKITKREYNNLRKLYEEKCYNKITKKKFPQYPKSGKWTIELKKIRKKCDEKI